MSTQARTKSPPGGEGKPKCGTSFRRSLTLPLEGKSGTRDVKAGDVAWGKAQVHIGENVGTTDTHVIMVELKKPGS